MARHWTGARVILGASCRYLASLGIPSKLTMLDAVVGAAAVQSISVETVLGGGEGQKNGKTETMAGENDWRSLRWWHCSGA